MHPTQSTLEGLTFHFTLHQGLYHFQLVCKGIVSHLNCNSFINIFITLCLLVLSVIKSSMVIEMDRRLSCPWREKQRFSWTYGSAASISNHLSGGGWNVKGAISSLPQAECSQSPDLLLGDSFGCASAKEPAIWKVALPGSMRVVWLSLWETRE